MPRRGRWSTRARKSLKRVESGDELVLGPFQGRPACLRIPLNKGVCGGAAAARKSMVVPDVHEFAGHIACDSRSRSEIVIPLLHKGRLVGVLDVDSPNWPVLMTATASVLKELYANFARLPNGLILFKFTYS